MRPRLLADACLALRKNGLTLPSILSPFSHIPSDYASWSPPHNSSAWLLGEAILRGLLASCPASPLGGTLETKTKRWEQERSDRADGQ